MPDTIGDVTTTETVRFQTGRFVSQPVTRTNLHSDLVAFLAEVLVVEEQDPSAGEQDPIVSLANSLIVNVLDAHLDATYWQGRQTGYGQSHGTPPVSDPTDSLPLKPEPSGASS